MRVIMRSCSGIVAMAVVALFIAAASLAKVVAVVASPQDRLLVLPGKFVHDRADRTERAQQNLEGSLQRAVKRDPSRQFVAMPELSADETAIVDEHTNLLRLIGTALTAASLERTPSPSDYFSIGNGLAFLAERTGADRAIFVGGGRGEPLGGFKRILSALIVDLRSGDVLQIYFPERGFDGEPYEVAGANTWMHALFGVVPQPVPRVVRRPGNPSLEKPLRHPRPRERYVIVLPRGWNGGDWYSRHRDGFESIRVDTKLFDDALRTQGVTTGADPMRLGEVAVSVLKADRGFADMEVTSLTPVRVASRAGFRIELISHSGLDKSGVRARHLVYGFVGPERAYLLRYDALSIHYFDHYLPEFEEMVRTFKFLVKAHVSDASHAEGTP